MRSQPPRPTVGSRPLRPAWGHGPPDLCGVMAPQTQVGTRPPGPTVVSGSGEGSRPPGPRQGHSPPGLLGVMAPLSCMGSQAPRPAAGPRLPGPSAVRGRKLMELGLGHCLCLRKKTEQMRALWREAGFGASVPDRPTFLSALVCQEMRWVVLSPRPSPPGGHPWANTHPQVRDAQCR